jgi:hypothetical protein
MVRDEAERILGAWMGNGVGTVEWFTAAFGLKNVLSSRFYICLGLRQACAFHPHSARQAFEPRCMARFFSPAVPT